MFATIVAAWSFAPASVLAAATPDRPTVAVLYFDYSGQDSELAVLKKGLAQMLISDLSQVEEVQLVERTRLQAIITELKLQKNRKIDPKTAVHICKLLGAHYMVMGGYFSMMGTLRVDARLVKTETGHILKSVGRSGKKDDFISIEQKVSQGLAVALRRTAMQDKASRAKPSKRIKKTPSRRPSRAVVHIKRKKVPPPKRLKTTTALRYAKALDAKDRGDIKGARRVLKAVLKERPDFRLAQLDLAALVR